MDGSHPKNIDPRPKRRRDEENPYEIYTTGINTTHPRYFLAFTDSNKVKRWMEIDKTLFDAVIEFELDDLSFFNEVDRHYERSEMTEATLSRRAAKPQESVEEIVSQQMEMDKLCVVDHYPSDRFTFSSHGYDLHIENELVADAFAGLSVQEQSILILHFVLDMPDQEVGRLVGMSRSAVQRRRAKSLTELRIKLAALMPKGG